MGVPWRSGVVAASDRRSTRALRLTSSVVSDRSREEQAHTASGESVPHDPVGDGETGVGGEVEAEAAREAGGERDDGGSVPETAAAAAGRRGAGTARIVRGSAATVARGSAAATREGVGLVQRASRVTYWPAQLCVLAAILLQVGLSHQLTAGPRWLLPSLEGALLIGLALDDPARARR